MAKIKTTWVCKNCDLELPITIYPPIPARFGGPPDSWAPAEPGDIEPGECPCGAILELDEILAALEDKLRFY